MATFPVFPDTEAAVGVLLRDAIGELNGRVYSSIPATPVYPLVTFVRAGGLPAVRQYLDAARIDVSVWGNTKGEAHDFAQECRAAIHSAEGSRIETPVGDVWISGVEDLLGLTYLQDPDTHRDRYVFGVRVYAKASASQGSS